MASADENCCINELVFRKQSELIGGVIAGYISRSYDAFKGLF